MDIPSPPPHHQATPPPPPPPTTTPPTNLDPDLRIQQIPKQLPPPFTNGVLKRHKPRHHHSINNLTPPVVISYKECLKNHAASMGGHAVDGCGEFMPSPTSTPTDPTSLKCAACGCHRNFHRRDPDDTFHTSTPYLPSQHVIEYQPHHRHHPPPPPVQPISVGGVRGNSLSPADSPSPPPISSSYYPSAPHMLLALSSAPPENTHTHTLTHNNALVSGVIGSNSNGKKRFRTKFTQDQKQKMHDLAERVGWKMQKKDEDIIIGCCNEIGVEKGVFKVWMHNNKMTLGNKKESGNENGSSGGGGGGCGVGGGIDFLTNHQHQHQRPLHINTDSVSSGGGGGVGGNVIGTNGSSSSS